jgi:hypothetical protein
MYLAYCNKSGFSVFARISVYSYPLKHWHFDQRQSIFAGRFGIRNYSTIAFMRSPEVGKFLSMKHTIFRNKKKLSLEMTVSL